MPTNGRVTNVDALQTDGATQVIGGVSVIVLRRDNQGNIIEASLSGLATPPTTGAGFAKNAIIYRPGSGSLIATKYLNVGTPSACEFVFNGPVNQVYSATLTAANLQGMFGTAKELLPAYAVPSAGILSIIKIVFKPNLTSTTYTGGGAISVYYGTTGASAGVKVINDLVVGTLTSAAGSYYVVRQGIDVALTASATIASKNIVITNATGAFATGTGTMSYYVEYSVGNETS